MGEKSIVKWRCRRGMLELDILLENYFNLSYDSLSSAGRLVFASILQLTDGELNNYLVKQISLPDDVNQASMLLDIIRGESSG